MSVLWFIAWLISDHVGDHERLTFDPVNVWAGTLLLAAALDVGRPHVAQRRRP
jgi:hypothetical protein